ncbi:MAG: hypothetical protein EBU67_11225 [Actinobacteria bacterium]|nr:hypothetical protein [Actinomycetota bacterium]
MIFVLDQLVPLHITLLWMLLLVVLETLLLELLQFLFVDPQLLHHLHILSFQQLHLLQCLHLFFW